MRAFGLRAPGGLDTKLAPAAPKDDGLLAPTVLEAIELAFGGRALAFALLQVF